MIECSRDAWLSGVAGMSCFKLSGDGESSAVRAALAAAGSGFFFSKVPVTSVGLTRRLCDAGFYLVDTNVVLEMPARPRTAAPPAFEVALAQAADHAAAQAIAGSSFAFSRFHLDPLFPHATADLIKREWIRSYCEGRRGDALFVARKDGQVAGFLAALVAKTGGKSVAVIDLIAVERHARGNGVGPALVARYHDHYAGQVDILRVGTQIANVASLGLYRRCGFGVAESGYVLHAHVRDGACL